MSINQPRCKECGQTVPGVNLQPHNKIPKDTVEEILKELDDDIIDIPGALTEAYKKGVEVGRIEERERIEAFFKEFVPPHAMDLEDSVWLKRLLNKAFNHN